MVPSEGGCGTLVAAMQGIEACGKVATHNLLLQQCFFAPSLGSTAHYAGCGTLFAPPPGCGTLVAALQGIEACGKVATLPLSSAIGTHKTYSRTMPRPYGCPRGGGCFLLARLVAAMQGIGACGKAPPFITCVLSEGSCCAVVNRGCDSEFHP